MPVIFSIGNDPITGRVLLIAGHHPRFSGFGGSKNPLAGSAENIVPTGLERVSGDFGFVAQHVTGLFPVMDNEVMVIRINL